MSRFVVLAMVVLLGEDILELVMLFVLISVVKVLMLGLLFDSVLSCVLIIDAPAFSIDQIIWYGSLYLDMTNFIYVIKSDGGGSY